MSFFDQLNASLPFISFKTKSFQFDYMKNNGQEIVFHRGRMEWHEVEKWRNWI